MPKAELKAHFFVHEEPMANDHFREYELTLLLSPALSETDAEEYVKKFISEKIEAEQGEITFQDFWGKRRLAYPIKKETQATYVVLNFLFDPAKILPLDTDMRLDNDIIRHLMIAVDKHAIKMTQADIEFWNQTNLVREKKSSKPEKKVAPKTRTRAPEKKEKSPEVEKKEREEIDKKKLDQKLDAILGDTEI